jgi:hypothetical protein
MSQDLITNKFRYLNLTNLNRDIETTSINDRFYLFIGEPNIPDDSDLATPVELIYSDQDIHRNMVSMKYIDSSQLANFSPVVERRLWATGTVYQEYSNNLNLSNVNFYTISPSGVGISGGKVYICLDNNSNNESNIVPTHDDTSDSTTATLSDGYVWEWIYTIPADNKFDEYNGNYMPVINGITSSNSKIVKAVINSGGSGYGNNGLYICPIVGDGSTDGQAHVTVQSGIITDISVIENQEGSGFTFANIDLRNAYVSTTQVPTTSADIDIVLSPSGGFGFDNTSLLSTNLLMVYSELVEGEGGNFPIITSDDDNDPSTPGGVPFSYGQIGIIKNPLAPGSTAPLNVGSVKCLTELTLDSLSSAWDPKAGDEILGLTSGGTGVVVYWDGTSVLGVHQTNEVSKGLDSDLKLTPFGAAETIKILEESGIITSVSGPEYEVYSGDILYVMNTSNIDRAAQQKEIIKLVIDFNC